MGRQREVGKLPYKANVLPQVRPSSRTQRVELKGSHLHRPRGEGGVFGLVLVCHSLCLKIALSVWKSLRGREIAQNKQLKHGWKVSLLLTVFMIIWPDKKIKSFVQELDSVLCILWSVINRALFQGPACAGMGSVKPFEPHFRSIKAIDMETSGVFLVWDSLKSRAVKLGQVESCLRKYILLFFSYHTAPVSWLNSSQVTASCSGLNHPPPCVPSRDLNASEWTIAAHSTTSMTNLYR